MTVIENIEIDIESFTDELVKEYTPQWTPEDALKMIASVSQDFFSKSPYIAPKLYTAPLNKPIPVHPDADKFLSNEDIVNVLRQVRKVLLKRGWARGTIWDRETNRVCLRGALLESLGYSLETIWTENYSSSPKDRRFETVETLLLGSVKQFVGFELNYIPSFNDMFAQNVGDILNVIDNTIDKLDPECDDSSERFEAQDIFCS